MEEKGSLDHYSGAFPATLKQIWGRIYSEWFPSSNYELAPGPEMLWNEGGIAHDGEGLPGAWR